MKTFSSFSPASRYIGVASLQVPVSVGTVHNIVRKQPETLNTSTEFVSARKPLSIIYPAVYTDT